MRTEAAPCLGVVLSKDSAVFLSPRGLAIEGLLRSCYLATATVLL